MTSLTHRGCGLATHLLRFAAKEFADRGFLPGGAFTDETRLFRRVEHVFPGNSSRYVYVRNAIAFFRHHMRAELLARLASGSYNMVRSALAVFQTPKNPGKVGLALEKADPDQLIEEGVSFDNLRYDCPLHFNNSLAKIAWKMRGRPMLQLLLLRRGHGGAPLAYCVLKDRHFAHPEYFGRYGNVRVMTMMDFGAFGDDRSAYSQLLAAVFHAFLESGADVLDCISTSPALSCAARKIGMLRLGKGMCFHFATQQGGQLPACAGSIEGWFLTHFCGDGFSFQ